MFDPIFSLGELPQAMLRITRRNGQVNLNRFDGHMFVFDFIVF